eukprot:UN16037
MYLNDRSFGSFPSLSESFNLFLADLFFSIFSGVSRRLVCCNALTVPIDNALESISSSENSSARAASLSRFVTVKLSLRKKDD